MKVFAAAITLVALAAASPAIAQDSSANDTSSSRNWIVSIGGGAQLQPRFPGARDDDVYPLILGNLRREGDPLPANAPDDGAGFGILGARSVFDFGPTVQIVSKRRDSDVGAPIGQVDDTVEIGGFVSVRPVPWFRLRVAARKGLGGDFGSDTGHRGWDGDVMGDFILYQGPMTVFTIGPRARFGDDRYMEAYFGVTPAASARTGLAVYRPDGGIRSVGVNASYTHEFSNHIGVRAFGGYDRLIGDASDSPIVRVYGSRDQWSAGLGLFYSFNVGHLF